MKKLGVVVLLSLCASVLPSVSRAEEIPGCQRPIWPGQATEAPDHARVREIVVEEVPVSVLLPPGYETSHRRYPVLYLLHGGGQWSEMWRAMTDVEELSAEQPLSRQAIVVMPDGGFGTYTDVNPGESAWERFHIRTLVPAIDRQFRTIADREHRAIAGESGGALGSAFYAARHPDLFGALGGFSGPYDVSRHPWPALFFGPMAAHLAACPTDSPPGDAMRPAPNPLTDEIWYRANSPPYLATNLHATPVRLVTGNALPCDPEDLNDYPMIYPSFEPLAADQQPGFDEALRDAGGHYEAHYPACGTHSFKYFERYLHDFWTYWFDVMDRGWTATPRSFNFRSADSSFAVWDWAFEAAAGRAPEFLDVHRASKTGLTIIGSGRTTVTTPAFFGSNQPVVVSIDGPLGSTSKIVRADGKRLRFTVDLGPPHTFKQYTAAQQALEAAGGYWQKRTVRFAPIVG